MTYSARIQSLVLLLLTSAGTCIANDETAKTQWVDSDDGPIAIRLSVESANIVGTNPIRLIAEFRNTGRASITVLRPFEDWYVASATGIKAWNARKRIRYSGATVTYFLGAKAFTTIKPGETIKGTIELVNGNFDGIESADTYTIRYDYRSDGRWDQAAKGHGFGPPWRGSVCSREITVRRTVEP